MKSDIVQAFRVVADDAFGKSGTWSQINGLIKSFGTYDEKKVFEQGSSPEALEKARAYNKIKELVIQASEKVDSAARHIWAETVGMCDPEEENPLRATSMPPPPGSADELMEQVAFGVADGKCNFARLNQDVFEVLSEGNKKAINALYVMKLLANKDRRAALFAVSKKFQGGLIRFIGDREDVKIAGKIKNGPRTDFKSKIIDKLRGWNKFTTGGTSAKTGEVYSELRITPIKFEIGADAV